MSQLTHSYESAEGYLHPKRKIGRKLTRAETRKFYGHMTGYQKPEHWLSDDEVQEAQSQDTAWALWEIEHCGSIGVESGTHPIENFYSIFGWEGGTSNAPIPRHHSDVHSYHNLEDELQDLGLIEPKPKRQIIQRPISKPLEGQPRYSHWEPRPEPIPQPPHDPNGPFEGSSLEDRAERLVTNHGLDGARAKLNELICNGTEDYTWASLVLDYVEANF